MKNELIARGKVQGLCLNGIPTTWKLIFNMNGPAGDIHSGINRELNGHDGAYLATSQLKRGHQVFNWRTWTAISAEEIAKIENQLGVDIYEGCLLENIIFTGIPQFSQLAPTSRLVFPMKPDGSQLVLAVWEENTPCDGVGIRLQHQYLHEPNLSKRFIAAAQGKRGVMGFVLSKGYTELGDEVLVYPPAE